MRSAYRVLAYLICVEVVIQAAAIAYAVFGEGKYIEEGGVVDQAAIESEEILFPEVVGFIVHGINGMNLIPLIALILLIVSFFAKIPGGVKWAGLVLLTVVVQVLLGIFAHGVPVLGLLHGLNALVIFTLALLAARRVRTVTSGVDRRETVPA
jgi:hypothetical protein